IGFSSATPRIGDYRVGFELAPLGDISVVGQQTGAGFTGYQTEAGDRLLMVASGVVPAERLFAEAESANTVRTWIPRGFGFVLLLIAFALLFAPIGVIAAVIPPVARLVRMGTGILGFALAALVGSVTIAVAWFWYRPILALIIILVGVAIF